MSASGAQQNGDGGPPLFGAYRIEQMIGRGGFSTVYRAQFQGEYGFRKSVALKVLRRRLQSLQDVASADFLNEARLGASIRHPNLVEFYECGRVGDRLYIAMELIEGPNLAQVLQFRDQIHQPVTERIIRSIAVQTARGLKALHDATVDGQRILPIHQDMKPGNILLTPAGQAKITDYGVARFAADFYETLGLEGPRGSPLYMSPEQASGDELTQASDIFSFGSVMTELITGINPFSASNVEGVLARVRTGDVGKTLELVERDLPALAEVLGRCLRADPSERYADGAALVKALVPLAPDATAEEEVGALAVAVGSVLTDQMSQLSRRPVQVFWGELHDDEEQSESVHVTRADTAEVTPIPGTASLGVKGDPSDTEILQSRWERVASAAHPSSPSEPSRRGVPLVPLILGASAAGALIVLALAYAAGLFDALGGVAAGSAPAGPQPEQAAEAVQVTGGGEIRVEDEIWGPTIEEAGATPVPASPTARFGHVQPRVRHEPVTRGIRGKDTRLDVVITPPGPYDVTLWYRGDPGGEWQTHTIQCSSSGRASLVIPVGPWLTQEATAVQYFIDVTGPNVHGRSGSVGEPHRFRLY